MVAPETLSTFRVPWANSSFAKGRLRLIACGAAALLGCGLLARLLVRGQFKPCPVFRPGSWVPASCLWPWSSEDKTDDADATDDDDTTDDDEGSGETTSRCFDTPATRIT